MDIIILFLLNSLLFALSAIILARRFDRLYNSRAFLRSIEQEARSIMTSFNQNADEQLEILEDRIKTLTTLRAEVDHLIHELKTIKGDTSPQAQPLAKPADAPVVVPAIPPSGTGNPPAQATDQVNPVVPDSVPPGQEKRWLVMALFQGGFGPEVISQRTSIPLGEVELIIRLAGRG